MHVFCVKHKIMCDLRCASHYLLRLEWLINGDHRVEIALDGYFKGSAGVLVD